jgi:transketolase
MAARAADPSLIFLTGDLGFMALEPVRDALGERFFNAGVAEQNMVGVAAGLAREGMDPWVYSIAPFCYARPFEQIRNDVAFHRLPVKLVGNGGGFGYGVMGPTHHALEDYGTLLTLQGMHVFAPAFDADVAPVVSRMAGLALPSYLRLGLDEGPAGWERPAYDGWRQLLAGGGWVLVVVGALAGAYVEPLSRLSVAVRPNLWVVTELPLAANPMPEPLLAQLAVGPGLCVAEEHVAVGSVGAAIALDLAQRGLVPRRFRHLCVGGQVHDSYGTQRHMRKLAGIDVADVISAVMGVPSDSG